MSPEYSAPAQATDGLLYADTQLRERPASEKTSGAPSPIDIAAAIAKGHPVGGRGKRAFDFAVALLAVIVFSPILLLTAALVKLSSPGPIFYWHPRIGLNNRVFYCLKFRTMVPDGTSVLEKHLATNPVAAAEWQAAQKLKDDPRITPVGKILRKSSLDELPQLLNILRAEMSLIGPRPIVSDEMRHYGRDAVFYLRARPGLTGAWQVSGRNDVSYRERVQLDRDYVENWSFRRDLLILVKTIPAVLLSRGTY